MKALTDFFNFVIERKTQIIGLILEHIQLTFLAVVLAIAIGVPLGIVITRKKKLASPIIGFANVVQAIPSLALLGFLIPLLGIGSKPAIAMVLLYSLLPILKNTYTGITNINGDMIEAAKAMGMTKGEMLLRVEIPLALPIIMTGIRISAVTAVGLMTIAAFIGAGGLGYMVFSGVQTVNNYMILAGAIPACLLALLMDWIISKIEEMVTPKGIKASKNSGEKKNSKLRSIFIKYSLATLTIIVLVTSIGSFINKKDKIVVGSKNFNEQLILGHMISTLIEKNTDLKVDRKLNLGGTLVTFNAIKSGELDVYVEYTGTGLMNILNEEAIKDSDKAYDKVKKDFKDKFNIEVLNPLGFNNTYTLAMKKDVAEKHNINSFSDLANFSPDLVLGSTIEFTNREDGYKGLKKSYDMNFKEVKTVDGGLRYTSINNNSSDVIDAFSTDGLLKAFDLKVLKDDKNFFPPYHAVPMIKGETLKKYPELGEVINKLSGKLDDNTMRELNYRVDKLNEDPRKIAEEFLKENALIN